MILEAIDRWALRDGSHPAVADDGGGLTYADLVRESRSIEHALRTAGVAPGECVAVTAARRKEVISAILGIWRVRAAYVPIDTTWPRARVENVVADARPRAAITFGEGPHVFEDIEVGVLDVSTGSWLREVTAAGGPVVEGLAYVLYTSGSTGSPKGVEVPASCVGALLDRNERWIPLGPDDVGLCFHSLTFDVSVWEMFRPLTRGATLVLCDQAAMLDPRRVADWVDAWSVTHLCQTPTAFRPFAAAAVARPETTRSLRFVLLAGEPLRFADLAGWFEELGDESPLLWNVYGPTETTVYATARRVSPEDARREHRSLIGRELGHVSVRVHDAAGDGEIVIAGEGVARGYRNRPDETARSFGSEGGTRVYRSGDVGRIVEGGEIEFLGRTDLQVKLRGFRIELEEIEVNLRGHPDVEDCVAGVMEVAPGARDIVAGVVVRPGSAFDTKAVRLFLADRLPRYMRPARLVPVPGLPLTGSGKLDRPAALRLVDEALG